MDSFDRVEDLARTMCEAAGGQWATKGTKKNYWRAKAGEALQHADAGEDGTVGAFLVAVSGWTLAMALAAVLVLR